MSEGVIIPGAKGKPISIAASIVAKLVPGDTPKEVVNFLLG